MQWQCEFCYSFYSDVSIAEPFKSSFFLKTLILCFCSLLTYAVQKFLLQKIPPMHQWHLLQSFSKPQRLNVYNRRISSNKSTVPIFKLHLFEDKERCIFESAKLITMNNYYNQLWIYSLKKWFDSPWVGFCSLIKITGKRVCFLSQQSFIFNYIVHSHPVQYHQYFQKLVINRILT